MWFGHPGFSLDAARVYSSKLHCEEARAILEHIYHHSVVKVEIQVAWVTGLPKGIGEGRFLMEEGGGGRRASVSGVSLLQLSPFSLPSFPLSPETPDTQAKIQVIMTSYIGLIGPKIP